MTDVYTRFERTAETHADRPFCWFEGEIVTYAGAVRRVDRRAAALEAMGLGGGDRLALFVGNEPEFVYLLLAAARQGVTVAPLDVRLEGSTLRYQLDDVEPAAVVVGPSAAEAVAALADDVPVPNDATIAHGDAAIEHLPGARDLAKLVEGAPARPDRRPTVDPLDVAMVNYTSGTTGPPKGVRNPHLAFVDSGERAAAAARTDADDRALLVLPLFHANPLTYGLMHALAVGASIAPVRSFSASGFWETAARAEATFFTHVGSVLEILMRTEYGDAEEGVGGEAGKGDGDGGGGAGGGERRGEPSTGRADPAGSPLRFAMGGAANFADGDAFEARFGVRLLRLYGLSEVGGGLVTACDLGADEAGSDPGPAVGAGTTTAPSTPGHQGSIDDTPFDVRILAEDGRSWVPRGEAGEIVVRPERPGTMFRGYRGKADRTVEDWQDLWMHTGDLGRIDGDRNLRFLGRLGTSIRRHGENVSPWTVESAYDGWPRVEAVVAVGVADPVAGEEIKLYVRPADEDLEPADVVRRAREGLPDHLLPRYVEFVEEIPRTSTEKVERVALRDRGIGDAWDRTRSADGGGSP